METLIHHWPINICMRLCLYRCASVSPRYIRKESASAVASAAEPPAAGRGQRDGGNTYLITHILTKKRLKAGEGFLLFIFRSRLSGQWGSLRTNASQQSANNNIHNQLFLYSVVWWTFSPSRPFGPSVMTWFFTFTALCLHLHIFWYAVVLLCICTNTNAALDYLAKWWVAKQLLRVNIASEYCKSKCRRSFFILGCNV